MSKITDSLHRHLRIRRRIDIAMAHERTDGELLCSLLAVVIVSYKELPDDEQALMEKHVNKVRVWRG